MLYNRFVLLVTLGLLSFPALALDINLSGVGHLSVDNLDDGQDSSLYLASNSSRLNFNGSHEIQPGLKVLFQYETGVDLTGKGIDDGNGIDPDIHGGQVFTRARDSYIGLEGSFGKVLLGHRSTGDTWFNEYNLFGDQVGDIGNLWAGSGLPGRSDDVIYYESPDFDGIHASFAHIPEEGQDSTDANVLKAVYAQGDLRISVTHAAFGQGVGLDDHKALSSTVIYNFGTWDMGLGFQQETDIAGIADNDRDTLSFGGKYKLNDQWTVKAQYTRSESDAFDSNAHQRALGFDYSLGASTTLYFAYAKVNNGGNVAFQVSGKGHGNGVPLINGDDPEVYSFGVVFKFDNAVYSN